MRISVLGLGYVGVVSAACLARAGHQVIGVDIDAHKVALVNEGRTPVIEAGVGEIIAEQVAAGRLAATTDIGHAMGAADVVLVCVGTPSLPNGAIDLTFMRRVCEQMGLALRRHTGAPVIAVRSTLVPGTMHSLVIPTLESFSGKSAGAEFGVCIFPEFLREGSAVRDYASPPRTLIGELNRASGDRIAALAADANAPLVRTDIATAEMVKYADNAWHALKVGFANEIGNICKALQVDAHRVMDIFVKDTRLNLSPYYLRPGFAFGGSCLPKDLRALLYRAHAADVRLPILESILPSNALQVERAISAVMQRPGRRVGLLGLAFKAGTDDLRESPVAELAERLLGKGYDLRVYDANVSLAALVGANRRFILERIPHLARLLVGTVDEVLEHAETIVISNDSPEFREVPRRLAEGQTLIDLVRVCDAPSVAGVYEGVCW